MPVKVHLPDGRVVNFPDGMEPTAIQAEVEKLSAPAGDTYAGPDTFKEGFTASLADTASRTLGGIGRGIRAAVDPRNLVAAVRDAGTLMSNPAALVRDKMQQAPAVLEMAQRVASGDPDAGGEAIGTLATGLVLPRVASGGGRLLTRGGVSTMQNALKPTDTLMKSRAGAGYGSKPAIAEAVLQEGRNVSRGGLTKAQTALDATDAAAKARLSAGAGQGVTVDAVPVAQAIEDTAGPQGVFGRQINAGPDVRAIRDIADDFLSNPHIPQSGQIPADIAHDFASNTGRNLRGKFGRLGAASVEAEKAGRENIVGQLRTKIPELNDLWDAEARQVTVRDALEAALNRTGNRDPIGLGTIVGAVRSPGLAAMAALDRGAMVKSLLARMLYRGGRMTPPVGATRGAVLAAGASEPAEDAERR